MGVKKVGNYQLAKKTQNRKPCMSGWIFFHEKFDVVAYLLHSTIFKSFWGTLGSNWSQKRSKITHPAKI